MKKTLRHDTPNDLEDDGSDGSSTPKPTEEATLGSGDRQSPSKKNRTPTPPTEEPKDHTPTPPAEEQKDRTPTPTADKERREQESHLDDTMPYSYLEYRDEPNAEAHVYAFLQTWEANHVSQRLTEPEAE